MAATSTLKVIADALVEEMGIGTVLPAFTGTTTTLTLTTTGSSELRGPFTGAKIAIGAPVLITAGGTPGEDTFVSNWVAPTGVITVSPAITTGATDGIIFDKEIGHADRVFEAINRAHQNRVRRWQKVPLTYVPDGEMLAATIADYWTASAGTASYQSLATPELNGRVIQISHSSTATLTGNTIPARAGEVWRFETAIRATTDGDTAALVWRDVLAGSDITPTYDVGDGSTTSRSFVTQRGYFTVPGSDDTDARIAVRLTVSGSGTMTAQMAPVIAYPQDARSFPFNNRVHSTDRIGNFYYTRGWGAPSGPEERAYTEPITTGGYTASFSNEGDHLVVSFNFQPVEPVYYDELVYGGSLSAVTDTTTFPLNHVIKHAEYELTKFIARDKMRDVRSTETKLLADEWRRRSREALRASKWSEYEPELVNVVGRR